MPKDKDVTDLIHQAQALLNKRHHQEARALFLQTLDLRPDLPDAHYGLATVCFLQGDFLGAAHHFKEVTRHDPLRAGAFINLGALYNHLGREDDAVAALRRGIQLDPNRAEGYYNLGLVYRRIGKLELAVEAYREAVRLQPNMGEAHLNLANTLLEGEKFDTAVTHYRAALKSRPDWPEAQQGLAAAEAGLDQQHAGPAAETIVEAAPEVAVKAEPDRPLDPAVHGVLMAEIHRAAAEAETLGKSLSDEIALQLEASIKELSQCFLRADAPVHELESRLAAFEASSKRLKAFHLELEHLHDKIHSAGEDLKKK